MSHIQPSSGYPLMNVTFTVGGLNLPVAPGHEDALARVASLPIEFETFQFLRQNAKAIAGSKRFQDVLRTFPAPERETPAGFRIELSFRADGLVEIDAVRDIGRDKNGVRRPTKVIYSADSANPYEIAPVAGLLGNLTCNPGIVYDMFINNPAANIGGRFETLEEVITEIGSIVGSGVDVSVELENPFEPDFEKILAEIAPYEKILSPYRLVVKVPHMGPVNAGNVGSLLNGDKRLSAWHAKPSTEDAFRSHQLALRLQEHGYRVNYTLMFEPHQTALALQARPYFINAFIRQRLVQSHQIRSHITLFRETSDKQHLEDLRRYLLSTDHLSDEADVIDLVDVLRYSEDLLRYRRLDDAEGADGLDSLRHGLRMLKQCHLSDTRIIVCSMEGPRNYPDIDRLIVDPEFEDVADRLIITAEPRYLARFTSSSHVVSYQRRFMAAAATAKKAAGV